MGKSAGNAVLFIWVFMAWPIFFFAVIPGVPIWFITKWMSKNEDMKTGRIRKGPNPFPWLAFGALAAMFVYVIVREPTGVIFDCLWMADKVFDKLMMIKFWK